MTTYVVDQNRMRKPELQTCINEEPGSRFVIPDVALVEMSKSETHWQDTMKNSLAPLRPALGRTILSLSIGEAMSIELSRHRAITSEELLPDDFTNFVRELVVEFDENRVGTSLSRVISGFKDVRAKLANEDLDAHNRKAKIEEIVELWRSGLKPELLSALRSGRYEPGFRLAFIQSYVDAYLFPNEMEKLGLTETKRFSFRDEKPMLLRYMYLVVRHALDWAISSGLENTTPEKELNHLLDMEYAAIASYYDGLISEDKGARRAYDDLAQILNTSTESACALYQSVFVQIFPEPNA